MMLIISECKNEIQTISSTDHSRNGESIVFIEKAQKEQEKVQKEIQKAVKEAEKAQSELAKIEAEQKKLGDKQNTITNKRKWTCIYRNI